MLRWLTLGVTLLAATAGSGAQRKAAGKEPRSVKLTRVTLGGAATEFAAIPGGEFMMGALATDSEAQADEKPAHRVKLSGFEIGVTEVTVGQFQAYCRATGKEMPKQEDWNNTAQHPMHKVNWNDATGYCAWATSELRRAGIPGTIRLPTEAEWEYAARGGATGIDGKPLYRYPWGDQAPAGGDGLGNFIGKGDGYERTAPVGRFKPNGYGLRDMAGNVWEWCQDLYDEGYYAKSPSENPQGTNDSGERYRLLRGGSWDGDPSGLRASYRLRFGPGYRYDSYGFRVARTLKPSLGVTLPAATAGFGAQRRAAGKGPRSVKLTRVTLGGVATQFAAIPGGEFMMGALATDSEAEADEKPAHRVKLSGFEMGVTEVTVGQFQAYWRATGKEMPKQEDWNNTAQHPVHNVTWDDATGFCMWATGELKRQGLPGSVRLPTEAEWEYAARSGDTGLNGRARKVFVWGDHMPQTAAPVGNLMDARARAIFSAAPANLFFPNYDDGYGHTAPVGRFPANAFGLRDMAGNVFEWCRDRYEEGYYAESPAENPQGSADEGNPLRVRRGGSWNLSPGGHRASYRDGGEPGERGIGSGFRFARTLKP